MNFKIKTISEGIHNSSKFLIIILVFSALIFGAGCRSPKKSNNTFSLNDRVKYNASYDEELDSIFNLSEKGKWEEAEAEISLLLQEHPEDPVVQRISEWVTTQKTLLRQQAIEDRIRSVNARQTGMNPTLKELWNESPSYPQCWQGPH